MRDTDVLGVREFPNRVTHRATAAVDSHAARVRFGLVRPARIRRQSEVNIVVTSAASGNARFSLPVIPLRRHRSGRSAQRAIVAAGAAARVLRECDGRKVLATNLV